MDPWVRKIPWRRAWQPTPVFLLGESHGQRSLAGYSSWGHKESDMTERLNTFTFLILEDVVLKKKIYIYIYTHTHTHIHAALALVLPTSEKKS